MFLYLLPSLCMCIYYVHMYCSYIVIVFFCCFFFNPS
uniref:Uncharacterized protein n=1 Tax=Anguilla anguilla TaxID=7936 RepID=A0A0E9SM24_ANGAN